MATPLKSNLIGQSTNMPASSKVTGTFQSVLPMDSTPTNTSQTTPTISPLSTNLPATTNVNASTLGTQPLNVPTKTPSSTPPVTENLADSFLKATEVADTEAQKTSQDISTKLFNLIPELQGQGQALATAQDQAGVNRFKQELQGINSQILKKQAEIQQDDITLISQMRAEERRDTLLPFAQQGQAKLAGDAAIMRALKTSEIGVLNATALAKQGDIALAMETAKQAVDVKYAPYKEAIETYQAQLQALDPILSRDEKKQARAQEIKGQLAMKEIDKVANLQKDALANAIQNNAPQSILDRISKARTIEDITAVGSQYLVSPNDRLDRALKSAQLNKINAEIAETKTGTGKPPTDTQIANAGYAERIAQSNNIIDSKTDTFKNMNYAQFKLVESNNPLANKALSADQRQVAQAMKNFITAKLRKESGAAISPTEFADARATYFPSLGDDEGTLAQKKQLRDSVLSNLITGSGGAYKGDTVTSYLDVVEKNVSSGGVTSKSYAESLLTEN